MGWASSSARTWPLPSRARLTTGSPRNGSIAIRGCGPRSWCRCRTPNMRSTRSSVAPRTDASCRFSCSPCRKRRSAAGISGLFMPRPNATACRLAFMPARPTAIPSPRWDGRATTSRTTPAIPKPFSRRWRAWSAKACSPIFPGLKVVLLESGVTWLPAFLWRFSKFWRGVRAEVPWVDRSPAEIVRDHVRLTIQPFDAPADPAQVEQAIDHLRSDAILLYASDFPHWQFDGDETMPAGIPVALRRKILVENPLATYDRLSL